MTENDSTSLEYYFQSLLGTLFELDSLNGSSSWRPRLNWMFFGTALSVNSSRDCKEEGGDFNYCTAIFCPKLRTLNPNKSNIDTTSVFRGPMCRVGNSDLSGNKSLTVVMHLTPLPFRYRDVRWS